MSQHGKKYLGKSKYQGVYIIKNSIGATSYHYKKKINNVVHQGTYYSETECAKQYDLVLIKNGLEPVNILKRK